MNNVCFNGKLLPADTPLLRADNKSYRYGDGLFETMKVVRGLIPLEHLHFERLFWGLRLLDFNIPSLITREKLQEEIRVLCKANNCEKLARIRLSVSRGNGSIYDGSDDLEYLIECWPLEAREKGHGYIIDIFPDARKSCDAFSNLKSANYLPYVMASRYARHHKFDDCMVMNTHERIADASIANIFLIKEGKLYTPPLSEGCVNGVMRRYLLEEYNGKESVITIEDMSHADEVCLTNAVYGIRWVKQFRNKIYEHYVTSKIEEQLYKTIWR